MRKVLFIALVITICSSGTYAVDYRVVSQDETGVTVEFEAARPVVSRMDTGRSEILAAIRIPGYMTERLEGRPVLPVQRFFFQVPAEGAARLQVMDVDVSLLEGIVPEVWFGAGASVDDHLRVLADPASSKGRDFAVIAGTGTFRNRELVMVDIYPVIWDAQGSKLLYAGRIVVRLSFPPAKRAAGRGLARKAEKGFIVNASQAALWDTGGEVSTAALRTPFELSFSDNWLRLNVASTGIYTVSYNDLLGAGIDPSGIDPATLRLFSAGPLQQPDRIDDGGSFEEDYHPGETAIIYNGSNSGEFSPGESIVFYALGARGWLDALDPSAQEHEYFEHYYDVENVYWLTWGGSFTGDPARMPARDVTPAGPEPDITVDRYRERIHKEENNLYDPKYTDDRWYWRALGVGTTTFLDNFTLNNATGTGRVRTLGYGPYNGILHTNHATCYLNGSEIGSLGWHTPTDYFYPDTLDVDVTNLVNSTNTFRVTKGSDDMMYIMSYDIFYDRYLAASGGRLDFFGPAADGKAGFTLTGFPAGDLYLLDVTAWRSPAKLDGWHAVGAAVEFEDHPGGVRVHYAASSSSALLKPRIEIAGIYPGDLESLRDDPSCPHMVIIYHDDFESAAGALASYRSGRLPYVEAPRVKTVDVDEIYDNFSGGMKDPVAIRNYLKFLYDNFTENGEPVIKYALLMGNGTYDPKDILGTKIDYVPLYMKDYGRELVEDEDYFVRMDDGHDRLADIAIGRMTVLTAAEASAWVARIVRYESNADHGEWRNKAVLVADDEHSTGTDCDFYFMLDTEHLTEGYDYFPDFIDFRKIYLHHYPFSGSLKPDATRDLMDEWNTGAAIVLYTGHGSPQQMSDESVMQKSDVYSLVNGTLRPLFLTFSCSVGNIESPYQRSIGQEVVVREDGGAIAAISGTGGTLGPSNRELSYSIFSSLFTSADSTGTEPLGVTMLLAKPCCEDFAEMNNAQYILFGDPALTLAIPGYQVEHDIAAVDTMYKGGRYHLEGRVVSAGNTLYSFSGTARVIVQESTEEIDKGPIACYSNVGLEYSLPGKEIFRGTFDVTAGRFSADFVVPLRCRGGSKARIRTYVEAAGGDGVGAEDSLVILNNPTVPDNEGPPEIKTYFSGQATRVKQGATLNVEISDPDGIAILGGDPQSSIFLEFDGDGYPIFVTDYFIYDHGSSSTGRVEYPLHSGFTPGPHQVIVRAFDNLGKSANDTLSFDVVGEGLYTVSDVFNMPNPFRDSTNFVFQLSSEADVTLRVYNVSGRQIWHSSLNGMEGFNSIYWDGRDSAGDRPANGTYLYVLDVSFKDSFKRTEVVSGKAVLLR